MVGVVIHAEPTTRDESVKVLNVLRWHGHPLLLLPKPIPVRGATWGGEVPGWSHTQRLANLLLTHALHLTQCTEEPHSSGRVQSIVTAPGLSLSLSQVCPSTKTLTSAFLSGPDFSSAPSPRSQRLGSYWSELLQNHTDLCKCSENILVTSITWNYNNKRRFNNNYRYFDYISRLYKSNIVLKYFPL